MLRMVHVCIWGEQHTNSACSLDIFEPNNKRNHWTHVHALTACAIALGEVATLDHEVFDNTVKFATLVTLVKSHSLWKIALYCSQDSHLYFTGPHDNWNSKATMILYAHEDNNHIQIKQQSS